MADLDALTDEVLARCDALGQISDEPGCLTRTFLSPATKQVHELLETWMRNAGLAVRRDAIGNLIGRHAGTTERVFAVGSHIDTVPNAGKFDGTLGVLLGVAAAKAIASRSFRRALEVIAFSEEEGVRFRMPYLGSRAVCGSFDFGLLDSIDDVFGLTLSEALRDFGCDPAAIASAAYPPNQLAGFFEAHIEQGPVLESLNLPLGVVTAIIGQNRFWLRFTGHAGHAGAQPMDLRRDALAAAAEFVTAVEQAARATEGARATVGSLTVAPGAINVVPGEVRLSLNVRHETDAIRRRLVEQLLRKARAICDERNLTLSVEPGLGEAAVACDPKMTDRLAATAGTAHRMVSGAGHDAGILASRCTVAMLFIRSPGGISHHPDEAVHRSDVRAALDVMIRFVSAELDLE
jgi:allantoate deiminase